MKVEVFRYKCLVITVGDQMFSEIVIGQICFTYSLKKELFELH